jgi:hypothetical protein
VAKGTKGERKMKQQDLIDVLEKYDGIDFIEVEDYNGNTILKIDLSLFDIADIEENSIRIQINNKEKNI